MRYPTVTTNSSTGKVLLILFGMMFGILSQAQTASAAVTLHTVGDSTVAKWSTTRYPRTGWGQVLPFFFDSSKVVIDDVGVAGSSAKSYYDSNWAPVKNSLKAGDFVTIQFGINDADSDVARHTDPFNSFEDYETKFVNETKAKGAIPILVSTVNRNSWTSSGTIYPAYHNYPIATRQLAATLGVPLIDLDKLEGDLRTSLGETYSLHYLSMIFPAGEWPRFASGSNDSVHFTEFGAIEIARLVVTGIKSLSGDAQVSKLIPALTPTYRVEFRNSNSTFGFVTRTQYYPAGITVTALALPNAGHSFTGWSGYINSTKINSQFKMPAAAQVVTGHFK